MNNLEREQHPKISVLMSVYNEKPEILRASIESILQQTYKDFEYIIVFDAPDNFQNKIILEEYVAKDNRIKLLYNEKNLGLTVSLNRALKEATGMYIARMDADDISLPDRFLHQKEYLEQNHLDFIGGYVETISEDESTIIPCMKVPITNNKIKKALHVNNCIFHPTWFTRKAVFDTVGSYSRRYVEDYELVLRAQKAGFQFGNIPEVVLKYRMGNDSISRSNLFRQYLCMRYIQKEYFSSILPAESIEEYEKRKFSEKRAYKYSKSAASFSDGLKSFHNKHYILAFKQILSCIFGSYYYTEKIIRYTFQYFL